MDAQRSRRTKDQARKAWYAYYRQLRFAMVRVHRDRCRLESDLSRQVDPKGIQGLVRFCDSRQGQWLEPDGDSTSAEPSIRTLILSMKDVG